MDGWGGIKMIEKKCEDCEFDDTWKLNNDKSPCHWCDNYNEFVMKETLRKETLRKENK